ncbi:bifunctional glutamate N-acetyltransferase/amino-acid acetyltransferase ArgJ [endosymbiont of Ridgeia piscesae]|uniref:Arginine biosynthesis bifunctional protein ArgJ n=1 Tax=endosymbiont of Ridgeia piscesae TaxID=54398 RepID=A0A0T5YVM1_9GAMM|nr:bifunctional glutamate N-acetyltransferase/amino-acid acetyltransferase ArgJ [endosymbiont of Ridgeia piscesae]KRT54559.1 glutamate N-acetyltransferase [endosymbiont of Ridgeia piscesae]KRT58861.1 glutamate N-acetyltransferase [endosymbiont of Ridgeia piscesae]
MNGQAAFPVPGVRLGVAAAGIKYAERDDLLLIELAEGGSCAGVFTRNAFCAAPVQLAKRHLQAGAPRYLLVNSGNANAGTGVQGMTDALRSCALVAQATGCEASQTLPFSTGVIGENLPMACFEAAIPKALADLDENGWQRASRAIMTTDTRPKLISRQFQLDGETITVTGIAKGAGMIRPDMATMLAYLATDLAVQPALLQQCLEPAVHPSFNSISVDGDTSTNDACMLLASGVSPHAGVTDADSPAFNSLCEVVSEVCMELARELVRDAEGATKLVEILVSDAADEAEARQVAYTIAHSPLVKTALFASDPNWGRILAAVGRAGLQDLDIERIEIWLDDVCIVRDGERASDYTEEAGQRVMDQQEITIAVRLGRGAVESRVLTCDLSYDYVKINAEYRT